MFNKTNECDGKKTAENKLEINTDEIISKIQLKPSYFSISNLFRAKQLNYAETGCEFDRLSNDLKMQILSFLQIKELARIAQVSKNWQELSENNLLWNKFLNPEDRTSVNLNSVAKFICENKVQQALIDIESMKKAINNQMQEYTAKTPSFLFHNINSYPTNHFHFKEYKAESSVVRKNEQGEEEQLGFVMK